MSCLTQRKLEELDERSRNVHDVDKLAKQIEALNKFVTRQNFKDFQAKTQEQITNVSKIKDELAKYVDNVEFKDLKDDTSIKFKQTNNNIARVQEETKNLGGKISEIDIKATKASNDALQNNNMMKEINFNEMQLKLKKYKQESQSKLNEMILKLKKKVGVTELAELEKNIIEKLDGFLLTNEKAKADRD